MVLAAGWLVVATPWAGAQERYRLTDKDTWQQQAPPDPASPEGKLAVARKALAEDKPKEALKLAKLWLKENPNHPLAVQAHLLKGDAKTARRDYYKALFDYEYVIRQYPAAEEFNVALEREYRIAQLFASGVNRRFLGMPILPATGEAEEIFIRIQERAPGSELGEEASLALADLYYKQDEMASAADGYDLFLVNYPHSRHRERAMLRLIQSNLNRFRGPEFDPTGLLNATATIKRYQQEFPAAAEKIDAQALLAKIDQSEARKLALQAAWYDRRGEPVSATYLRQRLVTEHPATPSAQAALTKLPAPAVPAPTPDDAKP